MLRKHKDVRGLKRVLYLVGGGVNGKSIGLKSDVIDIIEVTKVNVVSC